MNYYLLFKSIHLISVISWMAGLLYLPRIFVYHAENNNEIRTSEIYSLIKHEVCYMNDLDAQRNSSLTIG